MTLFPETFGIVWKFIILAEKFFKLENRKVEPEVLIYELRVDLEILLYLNYLKTFLYNKKDEKKNRVTSRQSACVQVTGRDRHFSLFQTLRA